MDGARFEARPVRECSVVFWASFLGSTFGILQVYFPDSFLPPEFSALAQAINPEIIGSLTYIGADGRQIIRPPGLSDLPGGAAAAGMTTMVVGLAIAARRHGGWIVSIGCLAAAAIGMTALYLTQVRSLTIAAAASVGLFALVRFRRTNARGAVTLIIGASLVVGSYV
jgi:hypothetical protein